jgi:hypothetical protein
MKVLITILSLFSLWLLHTSGVKNFSYTYKADKYTTITKHKQDGYFTTTYRFASGAPESTIRASNILGPGDSLLFQRSATFRFDRGLVWLSSSPFFRYADYAVYVGGTALRHAYIGAYGTGADPILTTRKRLRGSDSTASFTQIRTNVWEYDATRHLGRQQAAFRLFLTGQGYTNYEGDRVVHPDSISRPGQYFYGPGAPPFDYKLRIYSVGNPATAFPLIEFGGDETAT